MKIFIVAMFVATTFIAPAAEAYWLPPVLSPASPQSGDLVSVVMSGGGCDYAIEEAGYPQITRSGSNIRIVIRTVHEFFGEFCTLPPSSFPWPLGTFEPGTYNVRVDIFFYDYVLGNHAETLSFLPMVVAAAPIPAPVNSNAALVALTVFMALVGCRRFAAFALVIALLSQASTGRVPRRDRRTDPRADGSGRSRSWLRTGSGTMSTPTAGRW